MKWSQAVSLMELADQNDKNFNLRGGQCKVYIIDYEKQFGSNRYLFLVRCTQSYSSNSGHIVTLLFDKGSSKWNKPLSDDVRVHCQCPSFIYWGPAYNSTNPKDGYTYNLNLIENREPNIRDPFRKVKVCKHIITVRNSLRNTTYKMLDKKAGIKAFAAATGLPIIPIRETFASVATYLEIFKKDIDPISFTNSLTKENYEAKLLSVGAII
nr:MAG TPA: hypothetical protein [Bacteriophage sp.]